jgi:tetratricopeptide (TPR) repeat protein
MFFQNRSVSIMLLLAAILYISLEVHPESLAVSQTSESQSNPLVLEQGKTVEREIKGGESHTYQLNLSAGQFLHVMVEQNRIDLYATLHGSGDSQLMDIKGWDHYLGKMPIYWIAAETGSYRIRVYPTNKEATNGKYKIRIEELRAASDEDRTRISAQAAFIEAYRLRLEGSKESKAKSIKLFSDATSIYKTLNDQYAQGIVLNYIGKNYTSSGEPKKALDYHNQALTLFKQLGDRVFEAEVLNEIGVAYFFLGDKQKALEYYKPGIAAAQADR